jgi:hypothetical protein
VFENDSTGKKYLNFGEVRSNIEKLTDDVAGKGGQIVNDPIKLRIYSNDCPDLTIIDLPGITRIDVRGQKDVERITTEMAGEYSLFHSATARTPRPSSSASSPLIRISPFRTDSNLPESGTSPESAPSELSPKSTSWTRGHLPRRCL